MEIGFHGEDIVKNGKIKNLEYIENTLFIKKNTLL